MRQRRLPQSPRIPSLRDEENFGDKGAEPPVVIKHRPRRLCRTRARGQAEEECFSKWSVVVING